jgi:tetratricopeptide (TPR) repeat protein
MKRYGLALIISICAFALLLCSPLLSYAEAPFEQCMKEFKEENYEEAIQHFLEARRLEPTSSTVAFYLGLTYKLTENYKAAVPYLRDAVTLTPRVKEALVELIDALYQTDDLKEAKEWIEVGEKEAIQPAVSSF